MRIAFITRSTLHTTPGGDTVQVLATAKYMRRAGIEVDIKRSTDAIDYNAYDLLHFFNIIRPADILKHIRSGKPFVVSPIFVDYSGYDKGQRKGLPGLLFRMLPTGFIEYAKAVARYIAGKDKIASPQYLWLGHNASIKKILRQAACLLPNSESEYRRIRDAFGIDKKYIVVPNGIDTEVFPDLPANEKDPLMIVCAARIEGIKNQVNLIRAVNNTSYKLYLIGTAAPNQQAYYKECRKMAAANIFFIENVPQQELASYYSRAKLHVLPSWFETTGLSSLEAAAMGCNVVAGNRGDAGEYFGSKAFYCDPASATSIYHAIEKAAASPVDPALKQEIRRKFTWQEAALVTIRAYQGIV
jgi:glycosyltransferase involved in cell wall biosynthesis